MGIAMCVERDAGPSATSLRSVEGKVVGMEVQPVETGVLSGVKLPKKPEAQTPAWNIEVKRSPQPEKSLPKRRLNAWIDEAAPEVGHPFNITINIGRPDQSAAASAEFTYTNRKPVNLVISLSSLSCDIDPEWQELVCRHMVTAK